jgi:predicted SnoaL-like aldol condensation-catalyzing enzyme
MKKLALTRTCPTAVAVFAFLACGTASAQGYLNALDSNKKVVSDFYRLVFEPRNAELAEQYMAPDFIEHDPRAQSGFDGFVKFLKALPADSYDVGSDLRHPPAFMLAERDLVTFVFKVLAPDPKDSSKTYERFVFDTFRIKDRKIVEHWSSASK